MFEVDWVYCTALFATSEALHGRAEVVVVYQSLLPIVVFWLGWLVDVVLLRYTPLRTA